MNPLPLNRRLKEQFLKNQSEIEDERVDPNDRKNDKQVEEDEKLRRKREKV